MKFETNKEKGNTALGIAIAYFTSRGDIVSVPLNDTQDYDLIIEENSVLRKIQVKASGCIDKNGKYQVALKSWGGTKGKTYKTIVDTDIDYLFILLKDMTMYLIPINNLNNKSTLTICNKYNEFQVRL